MAGRSSSSSNLIAMGERRYDSFEPLETDGHSDGRKASCKIEEDDGFGRVEFVRSSQDGSPMIRIWDRLCHPAELMKVVTYPGGRKASREIDEEYLRQVRESGGFDITLDLGVPWGAPIIPLQGKESDPEPLELSELAISTFNSQHNKKYKFEKNLTVNASLAAGMWYYITFQARNTDVAAVDFNELKTFQALAWWGIDESKKVKFCRLKGKPLGLEFFAHKEPSAHKDSNGEARATQQAVPS